MPNIMAHSHIAAEVLGHNRPSINLGATLPDFAGMYAARTGNTVAIELVDRKLGKGIGFHYRTDAVFNAQPEKPRVTTPLAAELEAAGISNGAARMTADFAGDVLLDSALLDYDVARFDFNVLGQSVLEGLTALNTDNFSEHFVRYTSGFFRNDIPRHYADPRYIAHIAQSRLEDRMPDKPGRTFATAQIPVVGEVIGRHAGRAGVLGLSAMVKTIGILRSEYPVAA